MTTYATQTTINDIPPLTHIISGASQTVFNTNWTADADTDVVVFVTPGNGTPSDATQIVNPIDYVVTFIGASQTVRVTFNSAQTLGDLITITRLTPASRLNLYTNTNFAPTMLNQDVGILTLVDQQAQLVNQYVAPRYNYTAQPVEVEDTILPVLEANQIWAKNNANNAIIAYDVPASGGVAPKTASYLIQTATSELPYAQAMGALASGFVVNTAATGVQLTRTIAGTTNQIDVANVTGISGNPTFSLSSTLNLPGTFTIQSSTVIDEIIDDDSFATALATNIPTAESVKAYVDGLDSGSVKSVTGTANQVDINNTDPQNPIASLSSTINAPGTFTIQSSIVLDEIIDDDTFATATDSNIPTAESVKAYVDATSGGLVASVNGTANQIDVDNTDPANPILELSATMDAPGTFTVQSSVAIDEIIDDDSFATATATNIPTSESVKAYVDAQIGGAGSVNAGQINDLGYYAAAGDAISPIATANSAILRTDATGVPGYSASLTDGQLLIGDTSGTPTPATLTAGTGITITNGPGSITIESTATGGTDAAFSFMLMGG